jgi:hypothetical protein
MVPDTISACSPLVVPEPKSILKEHHAATVLSPHGSAFSFQRIAV